MNEVFLPYELVVVGSWFVFALLADKRRLVELAVYGAFSGVIDLAVMFLEVPFHWWDFTQFGFRAETIIEVVVSLSLFMVQGMLFVQYFTAIGPGSGRAALLLGLPAINTLGEATLILFGWVRYGNGWNLWLTYISCLVPFALLLLVERSLGRRILAPR